VTRPKPLLITFSGIDGAGKSTQIQTLCDRLHEAGLRCRVYAFWDDVAVLRPLREAMGHAIFRGDRGVGKPEAPIRRRDKNVRSPLLTLIRLGMYVLDALSLRRFAGRALRSGVDVVIFDRYIFDELANLNLLSPTQCLYARSIMKIVPRPGVAFILDADPVRARSRKPEYPLTFLRLCRESYLRLSELHGGMMVIPPRSLSSATAAVVAAVLNRADWPILVDEPEEQEAHPLAG
jgi:thymidylate kinase